MSTSIIKPEDKAGNGIPLTISLQRPDFRLTFLYSIIESTISKQISLQAVLQGKY